MKKLILATMLTGATIVSIIIFTSFGCSSQGQLGGGSGSVGGAAGGPTLKLDGSIAGASGKGGSGGAGTTPPTGDATCGSQSSTTSREPPDVMLVLDRSSSMAWSIAEDNCYCSNDDITFSNAGSGTLCSNAGTSDCSSRWSAVEPAVTTTVTNSTDVNWGLKFFATPNSSAQCTVSSTMEVEIGSNNASTISSQVQSATLSLSTPTAMALNAATAYLTTLTDTRPKFILLATDGEPNCGGNPPSIGNDDITRYHGATDAAKAAYAAGFPVYVIGIGPNPGNLTTLAQAGGTKDYFPASSPDQLVQAFADIKTLVASCTFTLTTTPPDINNIWVYLDKNLVQQDPSNGWSFGGGQKSVVLNGSSCDKVTSGQASTVEILYGCPGEPPPPTIP